MQKKVYVPVRVDPNTLALLKALAAQDPEASVSSVVRTIIRDWFDSKAAQEASVKEATS